MNEKIPCLRGVVLSVVSYYNWIHTSPAKPSVNAGAAQAKPLLSTGAQVLNPPGAWSDT